MKKINYWGQFNEMFETLLGGYKSELLKRVDKARDKRRACDKYNTEIMTPGFNELTPKIVEYSLSRFFGEMEDIYDLDNGRERADIFNEKIEAIEPDKRNESVKILAEYHAKTQMRGFWGDVYNKNDTRFTSNETQPETVMSFKSPVNWKGVNETEFVQFAYALHEAGYLRNKEKEITKLVEDFAFLLNFPLGRNWQVNLSTSIHKRNADYLPKIFDNLKGAYENIRSKKIEKRKRI